MQKLLEAPDNKSGDACARKRNCPEKKKEPRSLSAVTSGGTTPKPFC